MAKPVQEALKPVNPDHSLTHKLIAGMEGRLDKARAKGLTAVMQFSLSGDEGGDFIISIANQSCSVVHGQADDPDLIARMSCDVYKDIAFGRTTGPQAFFKRRLKFKGDLDLVMKLHALFPSIKDGEGG